MEVVVISKNSDPSFWRGRRVWLSGHTGFKGSWLALWLLHWGANVEGYSLDPEPALPRSLFDSLHLTHELARDVRSDILDLHTLTERISAFKPEVVFHLAAQPLVTQGYRDPIHTWRVNVIGTCNLLDALRTVEDPCVAVFITTDKVYENSEWDYGYREADPLGGRDPYSSSKAAAELAISSWRSSFCGHLPHQSANLRIASARAGNVIGGGDWSQDRIVPDAVRALMSSQPIPVRFPSSTRPWQHVLEPLGGYLLLAERLHQEPTFATAFNFGPDNLANRSVRQLVEEILRQWPGSWCDKSNPSARHEAGRLHLSIDRAYQQLGWSPRWNFETTIAETISWYQRFVAGVPARQLCLEQIERFLDT